VFEVVGDDPTAKRVEALKKRQCQNQGPPQSHGRGLHHDRKEMKEEWIGDGISTQAGRSGQDGQEESRLS